MAGIDQNEVQRLRGIIAAAEAAYEDEYLDSRDVTFALMDGLAAAKQLVAMYENAAANQAGEPILGAEASI